LRRPPPSWALPSPPSPPPLLLSRRLSDLVALCVGPSVIRSSRQGFSMSQEDKARALVEKAEKRLNSWSLFSSGSKFEDAAELYTKAANLFKVSKCCE